MLRALWLTSRKSFSTRPLASTLPPVRKTEEMPFIRYHSLWGNDHLPRQALNERKGALLKARGRFRRAGADAVWPSSAPLHGNGASGRRAASQSQADRVSHRSERQHAGRYVRDQVVFDGVG
jgi:hypothetical protein